MLSIRTLRSMLVVTIVAVSAFVATASSASAAIPTTMRYDNITQGSIVAAPSWNRWSTKRYTTSSTNLVTFSLTSTGGGTIEFALYSCSSSTQISGTVKVKATFSTRGVGSVRLNGSSSCFRLMTRGYGTSYMEGTVSYLVYS